MARRIIIALTLALALLMTGCRSNNSGKTKADPSQNKYAMPDIPAVIGDNHEAMDYIATHYWDKLYSESRPGDQDTSLIRGFTKEAFEEIFYQYALFLRAASPQAGLKGCKALLDKTEAIQLENPDGTLWTKVTDMYYHILQDPNSPWRNEEYCIPLIEKRVNSSLSTESQKAQAEKELPRFCLNRLGEKAADFAFTLRNGREMRMYDIQSEYTILFFSNPGCPNCREVMESLQGLPGISDLIKTKQLAVASVYPDEDLGEWIKYSEIYPKDWLNGYDHLHVLNGTHPGDSQRLPAGQRQESPSERRPHRLPDAVSGPVVRFIIQDL